MKRRLSTDEGFTEVYAKCVKLDFLAPDGKMRMTDTADSETILRVIQSIPSAKVEPVKQWLARLGVEALHLFTYWESGNCPQRPR